MQHCKGMGYESLGVPHIDIFLRVSIKLLIKSPEVVNVLISPSSLSK